MFATDLTFNDGCYETNLPNTVQFGGDYNNPIPQEDHLLNPLSLRNATFDEPNYMLYVSRNERPSYPLTSPRSFAMNPPPYAAHRYVSRPPQPQYNFIRPMEGFVRSPSPHHDFGYAPVRTAAPLPMPTHKAAPTPMLASPAPSHPNSVPKIMPAPSMKKHKKQRKEANKNYKKDLDASMYKIDLNKVLTGKDMRMTLMIRNIPNG